MIKEEVQNIYCPKCKLISHTTSPEVYGPCPYCGCIIHWKVPKERIFAEAEKEAI